MNPLLASKHLRLTIRERYPVSVAAESESMSEGAITSEDLEAHDQHIAQAAFVLWTENLSFAWTQLSDRQQDPYHAMVGRYLQSTNND